MRRLTLWGVSTLSALVLLFSYRTSTSGPGAGQPVAAGPPAVSAAPVAPAAPDTPSPAASAPAASAGTAAAAATDGTFTGDVADTRWGPVQVRITVVGGRITRATAVQQPDGNRRDQEINAQALPQLGDEVVAAQSAQIDAVSGATVTSDGYTTSLQSAIDAAHLGG